MKKILLLSLIALFIVFQGICSETDELKRSVGIDGKTQSELYVKVNEWFYINFFNTRSLINFQDKESGTVICNCITTHKKGLLEYNIQHLVIIRATDQNVEISVQKPSFQKVDNVMNPGSPLNIYKPLPSKKYVEIAACDREEIADSFFNFFFVNEQVGTNELLGTK
jgi:hypothetical protein